MPQPANPSNSGQNKFTLAYDASIQVSDQHWVVLVHKGRLLVKDGHFLHLNKKLGNISSKPLVHLGYWLDTPCFLARHDEPPSSDFEFITLRSCIEHISSEQFCLAARALQLNHWLSRHQYCGACAAPNVLANQECVLRCSRCDELYYPVIAPCVIGLIARGERLLLAQNSKFKTPFYSVLAGFIEVGESVEQAFAREVKEEVGLEIANIRYFDSQVWPFPSQLMIGLTADYAGGEIEVDGVEITHAQWFSAQDLPDIPPPQTLSGKLIRHFVNSLDA